MSSYLATLNHALASFGPALANHLWQSTAFAVGAWLLTLALRSNQARVRHAVWLAASLKFLVPFSLLIAGGNLLPHPKQAVAPVVYSAMDVVEEPFAEIALPPPAPVIHTPTMRERLEAVLPATLAAIWLVGAGVVLIVWASRWRMVRRTLREAESAYEGRELEILRRLEARFAGERRARPLPLRLSAERMEPGIFGVWRPVLVWPQELSARLDDEHIQAIVAHEWAHVLRRDNLTAALHMLVEAVFWFHPLVWWMERQMVKEREQACDEAVVQMCGQMGGDAQNFAELYADSLLKTCRFCIESPLACVAGVTGADLKRRVIGIVTGRALLRMSWRKKLLLAAAAGCVIAAPIVLGQAKAAQRLMLAAVKAAPKPLRSATRSMLAEEATLAKGESAAALQTAVPAPNTSTTVDDVASAAQPFDFDAVSIRPSDPNGGPGPIVFGPQPDGFMALNMPLNTMLSLLYGSELQRDASRFNGGPDWVRTSPWIIRAKIARADVAEWSKLVRDPSPAASSRRDATIQAMLVSRFKLKMHFETREGTVYALVVAKGGLKMQESTPDERGEISAHGSSVTFQKASMSTILTTIAQRVGSQVVDKTGLTGNYDFTLDSTPLRGAPPASADGSAPLDAPPSIFNAVEEQLGLKLVAQKGQVTHLVIDSAERPSVDGAEVAPANDAVQPAAYVPTMTFDVASIRETKRDSENGWFRVGGGFEPVNSSHLRLENNSLYNLISWAYLPDENHKADGYASLPIELRHATFNLEAKADADTDTKLAKLTKEQVRLEQQHMMQVLLADRFHLKVHWETRNAETYDLVVSKPGRLHTTGDAPSTELVKAFGDRPIPPVLQQGSSMHGFEYMGYGATAGDIAEMLAGQFGRPVNDKTGLTGKYYFHLKTYQEEASERKDDETNPWPPLESAIQDELGLKLVPSHGPVKTLVIDHAEMPSEN